MDIGQIVSIAAIVIGLLSTVISGLIGIILKLNSADRKTIKDSISVETEDRKKDIEKMENHIKEESTTLHERCNVLENEAKDDREKSHKTELKILSELTEIKVLLQTK